MKVSVLQLCSVENAQINLAKIDQLLYQATEQGSEIVFLPEVFLSMSGGNDATRFLIENNNSLLEQICHLAKKHGVYLLGGSAATKVEHQIMNRCYNISPSGEVINIYDKRNLFKCTLEGQEIDEAAVYAKGDKACELKLEDFRIGFNICVDLRYPQLFQNYRNNGCHIISCSSAFTKKTGKAHWHTLLRARAIENQCYIIAANQVGKHNSKMESYGHSLIIDPWGEILVDLDQAECVKTVEIELEKIIEIRKRITI